MKIEAAGCHETSVTTTLQKVIDLYSESSNLGWVTDYSVWGVFFLFYSFPTGGKRGGVVG
jgi:hypothetical protein